MIVCTECSDEIPLQRLQVLPHVTLCTECQSDNDVFKFKMKTVGFDEEPTIAKNKKDWDKLKKQRVLKDI